MSKAKIAVKGSDPAHEAAPTFKAPAPADDASNLEKAKWAANELGADKARKAEVVAKLKEAKVPHSESSIGQILTKARTELGFPALRNTTGGKSKDTDTDDNRKATVDDIKAAAKFAREQGMAPSELLALATRISSFGSLAVLEDALTQLEAIAKLAE